MKYIVAVDFDGTLCENRWPEIGKENAMIVAALKSKQLNGCAIILWTNRCGKALEEAIAWSEERGIHFDAINANLPEAIEQFGGDSRKVYANEYWDDKATNALDIKYETRIFGLSDDLVNIGSIVKIKHVEYSCRKYTEINCFDKYARMWFTDGAIIQISYGKGDKGIWMICVERKGSGCSELIECNDDEANNYSDEYITDAVVKKYEVVNRR